MRQTNSPGGLSSSIKHIFQQRRFHCIPIHVASTLVYTLIRSNACLGEEIDEISDTVYLTNRLQHRTTTRFTLNERRCCWWLVDSLRCLWQRPWDKEWADEKWCMHTSAAGRSPTTSASLSRRANDDQSSGRYIASTVSVMNIHWCLWYSSAGVK